MSRRAPVTAVIALAVLLALALVVYLVFLRRPPAPPNPTPAPTQQTFTSPLATTTEALHPPNFITPGADRRPQDAVTPSPPDGIAVQIAAAGGITLTATYWSPAASERVAAVVLLPRPGTGRSLWTPFAQRLQAAGIAALAVDVQATEQDITAALGWLAQQAIVEQARVGLIAAGDAAPIALSVADSETAVRAVALLSPQMDGGAATAKPLYILASRGDTGAAEAARQLDSLATGPHRVQMMDGSGRDTELLSDDGTAQALVDWLTGALAPLPE